MMFLLMLDTGYLFASLTMLDTECWMLDTGCWNKTDATYIVKYSSLLSSFLLPPLSFPLYPSSFPLHPFPLTNPTTQHPHQTALPPARFPASGISLPSYQEFTDASLRNVPIVDFFNLPILSLSMTAGAPELRSSGENSRGRQSNKTAV
ncbi:MAG: hypothetical protein KDH97_19255 [Calditrichaeota bacterium]|nr:hypothetical protein [Calditrichota bacterium]MCB0303871.1 hypothetical protein [Calditrichota bacterium]